MTPAERRGPVFFKPTHNTHCVTSRPLPRVRPDVANLINCVDAISLGPKAILGGATIARRDVPKNVPAQALPAEGVSRRNSISKPDIQLEGRGSISKICRRHARRDLYKATPPLRPMIIRPDLKNLLNPMTSLDDGPTNCEADASSVELPAVQNTLPKTDIAPGYGLVVANQVTSPLFQSVAEADPTSDFLSSAHSNDMISSAQSESMEIK